MYRRARRSGAPRAFRFCTERRPAIFRCSYAALTLQSARIQDPHRVCRSPLVPTGPRLSIILYATNRFMNRIPLLTLLSILLFGLAFVSADPDTGSNVASLLKGKDPDAVYASSLPRIFPACRPQADVCTVSDWFKHCGPDAKRFITTAKWEICSLLPRNVLTDPKKYVSWLA